MSTMFHVQSQSTKQVFYRGAPRYQPSRSNGYTSRLGAESGLARLRQSWPSAAKDCAVVTFPHLQV